MAGKKKISRHPNPYVFTDVIRETFIQSLDDALAASVGNANIRKRSTKIERKIQRVLKLMDEFAKGNIDLMT